MENTFKQQAMIYRRKPLSLVLRGIVWACGIFTVGILLFLLGFILVNGLPYINLDFLTQEYNSENLSALSSIVATLEMIFFSLLFSVPVGVFSAVYLVEYARRGSRLVKMVKLAVETLAGIPSIIYGLFGMILFVTMLGWQTSMLASICTLSIMVLPVIISSSEEALRAVPDSYREGSYGLGASRLRTVFGIVLPTAVPGILSGVILAIGRIVGETAALIFTSGTNVGNVTVDVMKSQRTLAIHMYMLANEGLPHSRQMAFATGSILILVVLAVNLAASKLAAKLKMEQK